MLTNEEISFILDPELVREIDRPVFHLVGDAADAIGRECYVVGGYVRDLVLHRPSKDIDFVTVGSGIEVARSVAAKLRKSPQFRNGTGEKPRI